MLPLRKKLVLVAVCSMTVFMMICAIVRIGVGIKEKLTDLSWFLLWNSVEMTLGTFATFTFLQELGLVPKTQLLWLSASLTPLFLTRSLFYICLWDSEIQAASMYN